MDFWVGSCCEGWLTKKMKRHMVFWEGSWREGRFAKKNWNATWFSGKVLGTKVDTPKENVQRHIDFMGCFRVWRSMVFWEGSCCEGCLTKKDLKGHILPRKPCPPKTFPGNTSMSGKKTERQIAAKNRKTTGRIIGRFISSLRWWMPEPSTHLYLTERGVSGGQETNRRNMEANTLAQSSSPALAHKCVAWTLASLDHPLLSNAGDSLWTKVFASVFRLFASCPHPATLSFASCFRYKFASQFF